MADVKIELNISTAQDPYQRLIGALPAGFDNMTADLVVPSHTVTTPVSLKISNVTPNILHVLKVVSDCGIAPKPSTTFVPPNETYVVTLPFAYGLNKIFLYDDLGNETRYSVAVTHYAVMFLAEAQQLADYVWGPITAIQNAISSPVSYLLAVPFIGKWSPYIPNDLETLNILGNKLISKNLLWAPGTDRGVREIFSAFGASNPYFHKMYNTGAPTSFLYRNEETFSGYEAHMWFPNRDIERWQTFIRYTANLPQVFSLKQIDENEVYVKVGSTTHRHVFDFESIAANTVIDTSSQCFKDLFRLDMTIKKKMYISFCQASYPLDNAMPPLLSPEADPLGVRNFTAFSLTGRFEQQYDEDNGIHDWVYEDLIGTIDGVNRYFSLSQTPASPQSIKLFLDGLLLHYLVHYRISLGDDYRSDIYPIGVSLSPILITIDVGEPRPSIEPVFATVEIGDTDNVEFLVTAVDQTLNEVQFVVSEPPITSGDARLHYVTPALAANLYGGANQYGTETIPVATVSYILVYPVAAATMNYQLLVQYGEDPAPAPNLVEQPHYIVRDRTLTGATIEFSDPIASANAQLHWWLIEGNIALEKGTVILPSTTLSQTIPFTAGPYFDRVCIIVSLWNTTGVGDVSMPLVAIYDPNTVSFTVKFSEEIDSANYRLDYVVFPAEQGLNLLEIFIPPAPLQIAQAQYDTLWDGWASVAPIEITNGVTQTFTLPASCPIPKAMYATLNGRLLLQGPHEQYTVEGTTLRLNFIPQPGQNLWCIYPTANPEPPESAWDQGRLNWGSSVGLGAYASGKIYNADVITAGDTVSLMGETFVATAPATGSVLIGNTIIPNDTLTFNNALVTITSVFHSLYHAPTLLANIDAVNVDTVDDKITIPNHGIFDNTIVYLSGDDLPAPLLPNTRYYVVNTEANKIQLSETFAGTEIDLLTTGSGVHHLYKNALPTEFPCGVDMSTDAAALVACINNNFSDTYYASYLGSGVLSIKALALTGTASNEDLGTPGVSIQVLSDIVGDTDAFRNEVQTLAHVATSGKWNIGYGDEVTRDIAFDATAADVQEALNELTFLSSVEVTGTPGSYTVTFTSADGAQEQPLLTVYDKSQTFTPADVSGNVITIPQHGFAHGQSVGFFSTGTLPAPLVSGTVYYVFDVPVNSASYTSVGTIVTVTGVDTSLYFNSMIVKVYEGDDDALNGAYEITVLSPTSFTYEVGTAPVITSGVLNYVDGNKISVTTATSPNVVVEILTDAGSGTHTITTNALSLADVQQVPVITEVVAGYGGLFPVGVFRAHDTERLADVINANPIVARRYAATAIEGVVTLKAKELGTQFNANIILTGSGSLTTDNISGGADPYPRHVKPAFTTNKPFYYADAPVVALDGVANRQYEGYGGNAVRFETQPEPLQIPYIVSQVYPIEHHPLDSMIANQPCSYPKGAFTQGLQACLTEMEVQVVQQGTLVFATVNAPIQEEPVGVVNGVNAVFDMSFATCGLENSLLVWIDGIFQPPTLYTYSVFMGHGRITFNTPPVAPQTVWVWYVTEADNCAGETLEELAGVVDGSNVNFALSTSVVDAPSILVFMQGLLSLQDVDYTVDPGNASITYVTAPPASSSMWVHYNTGAIGTDTWKQYSVAVGDDVTTVFVLPSLLSSTLPRTKDSVILALDGIVQRQGVDFFVNTGITGRPNGFITFPSPPATGQIIEVAYLTYG